MSSINSLGSSNSAWAAVSSQRAARPPGGSDGAGFQDKLFARLDGDGSGGVEAAELQGLLDKLSAKTGTAVGGSDPEAAFTAMDQNSDGSLDQAELDSGLKAAFAALPDTLAFARTRGADAGGGADAGAGGDDAPLAKADADAAGRAGGPPPGDGPRGPHGAHGPHGAKGADSADDSSSSSSSTTTTTTTDPLDSNGDGTVSASERAAGALKEVMPSLMQAVDSNSDGQVSRGEARRFGELLTQMAGSADTAAAGAGSAANQAQRPGSARALADQVLRHYAQAAAAEASVGSSLRVAA